MAHMVFIPAPGVGHLYSAVELAKLIVERETRLSVSILILTPPTGTKLQSYTASDFHDRITIVDLSHDGFLPDATNKGKNFSGFMDYHKPQVRDFLAELTRSESTRLVAVVLDMFCMAMTDVADEIGVPNYIFFTSGAGFLCLSFHALDHDLTQFNDSDVELVVPGFVNSVPAKALPFAMTDSSCSKLFLPLAAEFKHTKGILVNTFYELQSHAIKYLLENDTIPPIYPVGPIINLKGPSVVSLKTQSDSIISWLDNQPQSSVVFLCFGSLGCFYNDQVVELSRALENSGTRFLWSLRLPPTKGKVGLPQDYEDVMEVLPEGFLERTSGIGKVIGWAPQVAVLSHPSIGGFVSHCGWNSILESLWFGVPVATWPLFAEQHGNAFELVKEQGLAVEITLDHTKYMGAEANSLATAEEIENGIRQLMEVISNDDNLIKQKVKDMSKKSRIVVSKGGSSYTFLDRLIEGVIGDANLSN